MYLYRVRTRLVPQCYTHHTEVSTGLFILAITLLIVALIVLTHTVQVIYPVLYPYTEFLRIRYSPARITSLTGYEPRVKYVYRKRRIAERTEAGARRK